MNIHPSRYPFKGTLRTHQVRALTEAALKPGHCYFVDPGGGKTGICIAEAAELYDRGQIDGLMIFAPNGPHEQWIDQQLPLWCGVRWEGVHNRMTKTTIKRFMARRYDAMGAVALNYEALRTPGGEQMLQDFVKLYPRFMLVIDESQKIKNPTAERTHETLLWSLKAAYRRILSGTPLLVGLEDMWSQYEACQPGLGWPLEPIRMGNRGKLHSYGFGGFKSHYCITYPLPSNPRAKIITGYRNEDHLRERVAPFVTRIHAREFAVMEEPDIIERSTPMTTAQQAQYTLMEEAMIAQIDEGVITAQNALVQLGRLMQIASGFLYREKGEYEDGQGWSNLGTNKIDATLDLLDQLDEPVLVWAPFRALQQMFMIEMIDRAERKLPGARPFFLYDGDNGAAIVAAWQATSNGVMIGNQASGMGVGLNLQHAAANIYMANTFSSEARWQSIKRTDRMGQTRQVRAWDLISPRTAETKVMKALANKEDISRRNIDGLRELLK
jgi:hypothetical protein